MANDVELFPLSRADGSASHTSNGYSIIAAVNGPVEVQRKDEIPEEAAIDVVIRPAAGIGGVRERHLESIVKKALHQVIYVSAHPRTLIQVTLQVVATSAEGTASSSLHQSASVIRCASGPLDELMAIQNLPLLPVLLQSSVLALLSTSLPLNMALTSTLVAVTPSGELIGGPRPGIIEEALSLHVLAFSSNGQLLLAESEGAFDMDIWDQVYGIAEHICRGSKSEDLDGTEDINMEPPNDSLESSLRNILQEKTAREQRWKEGLS
ncbi:MAG: hypothetical protein Q9173_003138 [Seirophora scorigena]